MKKWLFDGVRQFRRFLRPRRGKLILTRHACGKLQEEFLDRETVCDVYRYGEEIKKNMIVRRYAHYTAGIIIQPDEDNARHVLVTTCWKRENWW
jgi:hypothetical protein